MDERLRRPDVTFMERLNEKLTGKDARAIKEHRFAPDDDPRRWSQIVFEAGNKIGEYLGSVTPEHQARYVWRVLGTHSELDDDVLRIAGVRQLKFRPPDNGRGEKTDIVRLALGGENAIHYAWPHIVSDHKLSEGAGQVGRVAESGRRMMTGGTFPSWGYENDRWTRRVLAPRVANPLTAFMVEREFDKWDPGSLQSTTRDNMAMMGYLFGFFDPKHPKHDLYKRLVLPTISDHAPEVIKRLKPKDSESLDSKRLERLKDFWPKTFITYWSSLCRTEGLSPVAVSPLTAAEGVAKLPLDAALYMPKPEATALTQAQFDVYRRGLMNEIGRLTNEYSDRGKPVEPEEILALFNREACHMVFDQGAAVLKDRKNTRRFDDAAKKLVGIFDKAGQPSRLEKLFGPGFANISNTEKVALLTYCAFVSNGSLIRSSERAVQVIEREIVPALKGVHDIPDEILKELQRRDLPEEEKYDLGRYMQFAQEAKHKLIELKPEDGIISAQNPELNEDMEAKLREVASFFETQVQDIWPLSERAESRKKEFQSLAFFAYIGALGVICAHASSGASERLRVMFNILSTVTIGFGAIASLVARKADYQLKTYKAVELTKINEKILWDKLKEAKTKMGEASWNIARFGLSTALALTAAHTLINQKEQLTGWFDKLGSSAEGGYDIGNNAEGPGSNNPRFIVLGENVKPGGEFWVDQLCITTGNFRLGCFDGRKARILKEGDALASQNELVDWSREQVASGRLVRINLDPNDQIFQTPVGYGVADIAYVGGSEMLAIWGPLAKGRVTSDPQADQTIFAVAYEPTSELMQLDDLGLIDTIGGMGELQTGIFDEPGMEKTKEIHDWTKFMYENRLQNGMTNKQILTGIQDFLKSSGVSYGFEEFKTFGMSASDVLRAMSRTDENGNFIHNKWICNQFSYYTYLIARSAGMDVYMPVGYQQDTASPYGGSDASRHQIILFKNEEGLYEIFDATLPSLDYLTADTETQKDPLEALAEQERNRNIMIASLATSMALLAASGGILAERSVRSAIKTAKEKSEKMLRSARRESIYSAYHAMLWLKDFDTEKTNNFMGSREAYAAQIAHDMVVLATGERSQSALAYIESINGHAEEEQRNNNLDWVVTDEETKVRMKEGGKLVLKNLQRYKETNYRHLSREQQQKVDKAFQILSAWVKAKPTKNETD